MFRACFRGGIDAEHACMQIRQLTPILKRFVNKDLYSVVVEEAERFAQENKVCMQGKFPIFLFELMERGIVNESAVMGWYESGKSKGLDRHSATHWRSVCEPFIKLMRQKL